MAASFPGFATASALGAYAAGRAAEGDAHPTRAAQFYAAALGDAPDSVTIARRAWGAAMASGDLPLARRALAVLEKGVVAPPEAGVFAAAEALRAGDAKAIDAALTRLNRGSFAFLTPSIRAWRAMDPGTVSADTGRGSATARRLASETRILLTIARGRIDAATGMLQTELAGSAAGLDLRYAAAELLAGKSEAALAQAVLRGDDPAVATVRARLRPATASAAYGISRLFSRVAAELTDARTTDAAIVLCRSALLLDPANDRARLLLAATLGRARMFGEGMAALDTVAADGAFAPLAAMMRVGMLDAAGERERALAEAKRLASAPGADDDAARAYADLLLDADRPREAAIAYGQARDRMGADADWRASMQLAVALDEAGRWGEARAALDRALTLAPDQALVLNYYGYALAERGEDLPRAQDMLEKANRAAPGQPEILDSLGWVKFRRGDVASALPLVERAAQASPASADIADHLGDIYWTVGRRYEARYAWRAASVVADAGDRARIAAKIANGPTP